MAENKELQKKNVNKTKPITIPANEKGQHINVFLNFMRCLIIPPFFLAKPFRYFGEKKVPEGACIFISNHYAMLDPVYVAALTWDGIHFIAKKELFKNPFMNFFVTRAKVIGVNRDGNDARGLLDCFKCLKNGEKICIFPEGTRNKTEEEMLPFHSGASVMAIKCKVPIVPVVIYDKPKFFRCTHVIVGEPIDLSKYYNQKPSDEELIAIDESLRQHMLAMKKAHKEYLEAKKNQKA